jgi:C1A family cysteine protease
MKLRKSLLGLVFAAVLVTLIMLPSLSGVSKRVSEEPVGDLTFNQDDTIGDIQAKIQKMREEIKKDGDTFEVGFNGAMEYPLEQICSLNPDMRESDYYLYEREDQDISTEMALPASYTGIYTSIKNQGSCGSCWAFGTTAQVETKAKRGGTTYNFSEQYVLDCNTSGYSCSGGWWAFNMFISPYGARQETCYPYTAVKGSCKSTCSYVYRATSWAYVGSSSGVPTTTAIKTAIYNYGGVAAAVYANSYLQAYTGGCYSRTSSGSVNHAIQLVGWNDTTPCTGGAWYLKNSWGTSWGVSGFMWIKYGSQQVGYAAAHAY